MKLRTSIARTLLDIGLLCLGILGSLLCLATAFSLPVPENLAMTIIMITVVNCSLMGRSWGKISALSILALLLLLTYVIRRELAESFRNLWGELIRLYAKGYDVFQDYLPEAKSSSEKTEAALAFLGIVQSIVGSISVRQWNRTLPVALVLLPGIVPCFVLTDTPPELLPLLLAIFSLMTLSFRQSACRRNPSESIKATVLSGAASAALLGLLLALFPQESYSPPISWNELTQTMAHWAQAKNNQGNLRAGLSGNPDQVELNSLGALPNRPVTFLYAQAERSGNYYLRSLSYAQFDGERWQRVTERDWDERCAYPTLGQPNGIPLSIQSVYEEDILFTTYDTTQLPTDGVLVGDSYLSNPRKQQSYTMLFLPEEETVTLSVDAYSDNPDYAAWVRQTYLGVPERTREGVLAWWASHRDPKLEALPPIDNRGPNEGYTDAEAQAVVDYARQVANLVSQCADYSRRPERVPDDVDFSTWFLNEAQSGYCVHYATACTALLRALGIPARYVTGYVCTLQANQRTAVTNLHAHAWVEIWSGGRWFRIEPTPGNATEFTGMTAFSVESDLSRGSGVEWTRPSVQYVPPDDLPEMTEYHRPGQQHPDPSGRPGSDNGDESDPKATASKSTNWTPVWILLGVLGLAGLIVGRRTLMLKLWSRRLDSAKGNERARLMFRRIQRLTQLSEAPIPRQALQIAQKAGFSQHTLSQQELDQLQELYDLERARVNYSGLWKKLYAKYLLCIV